MNTSEQRNQVEKKEGREGEYKDGQRQIEGVSLPVLNYLTSLVFLVGLPQCVRSVERWS